MIMSPCLRKASLITHVTCSVGWFGAVAAYLAVAVAGLSSQNAQLVRAAYLAMEVIGWYVIVPAALAALVTGLLHALGTPWGLFRHYWLLAKLLLTLVSIPILLAHMGATSYLSGLAADPTSTALFSAEAGGARAELVERSIEAMLVLLIATALAVYKPWGRTRYGRRKQAEPRISVGMTPASE